MMTSQIDFGEIETWRAPCDVVTGNFSTIDPIAWEECRERFSSAMKKADFKSFFFAHDEDKGKNVANFIYKTEEILNLSQKTTYNETSCSEILRINISDFWMETYVRRSLFTILVRLGNYYNENYEKALFDPRKSPANGYSSSLDAVKRFLYGFTVYNAPDPEYSKSTTLETTGWCKLFYKEDSWKKLVKNNKKISPIAVGKLWG